MSNSLTSFRRLAVTIALTGVTAIGAVALAPVAMADDTAIVESAPAAESAPAVESVPPVESSPAVPSAPVVESVPVVPSAPVVEAVPVVPSAPAAEPAPVVVTPPPVGVDKNGKEYKPPKFCTVKDLEDIAKKVAKATKEAANLTKLANAARQAATLLRAQAPKLKGFSAYLALEVARGLDSSAAKLLDQGQKLIDKASEKTCLDAPAVEGGRF